MPARSPAFQDAASLPTLAVSVATPFSVSSFYESPTGKKFVAEQPSVAAEARAAGTKWEQELAKRVMDEMQKEKK